MSSAPNPYAELLGQAGDAKAYNAGDILFTLGEPGAMMYLVESGSVDLFFAPGKPPKHLGLGGFFGELAFILGDHMRTATAVVSQNATRLRELDQAMFKQLVTEQPMGMLDLVRQTVRRLVDSEQQLMSELQQRNFELEASLEFSERIQGSMDCFQGMGLLDRKTGLFARQAVLAYLEKLDNREALADAGCWIIRVELDNLQGLRRALGQSFVNAMADWTAGQLRQVVRPDDMPFQIDRTTFGILLLEANEALVADVAKTFNALVKAAPLEIPGHQVRLGVVVDTFRLERFHEVPRILAHYGDMP